MSLRDYLFPQQAQAPGAMSQPTGLSSIFQPEVALPMAAALMGNQGNMGNLGNAFGVGGQALQAQKANQQDIAQQTKTYEFFKQNAPEFAQMIEGGAPVDQVWKTYTEQRYAQNKDPYKVVGGQVFNTSDKSWITPPDDGTPETGLVPQMMRNPETGETIYVQPTKDGKLLPSQVPEGFQPYSPYDRAYGGELGKSQAEMAASAPSALQAAENSLALIKSLKEDPARGRGTGFSSVLNSIPSSQGYGYQKKVEQAKAGAFLTSIQQLQGFGALSNSEGQTATAAVTRMDTAMSEADFLAALEDYERIVQQGYAKARRLVEQQHQVGGFPQSSPMGAPQRLRFNPETGELE